MLITKFEPTTEKFYASMRPRRVRLGCPATRSILSRGTPRFNEAEAHAPRMLVVVEKHDVIHVVSMRPRRTRLGCHGRLCWNHALHLASMRPRRTRLGCTIASAIVVRFQSFNEAEAHASDAPC